MDVTIIMVMLNNKQEVIMFSNPTNILFPPRILHTRKLSTIQSQWPHCRILLQGIHMVQEDILLNSKFTILGGRGIESNIAMYNTIIR